MTTSAPQPEAERHIDFDAARLFLDQAEQAQTNGDETACFAARKMVAIALQLTDGPFVKVHTAHLKGK